MTQWYKVENKASTTADIYLYDEIGGYGIDASEFIGELNDIKAENLNVHINSVGGEVYQGFAIYQALKDHSANVTITVDALAASIASVIAMAGDKVVMARNSEMMIHDGMVMTMGNASELRKTVDMLDRVSNNIASVYAERSGVGTAETWRESMLAETWYSAEEAVAAGLADEVAPTTVRKARNAAELRVFNYAGRKFAPKPEIQRAKVEEDSNSLSGTDEFDPESFIRALEEGFSA